MKNSPYRIKRICLICSAIFVSKKACKSRTPLYCSKKCFAESLKGKKATEKQLACLELGRKGFPSTLKGIPRKKEICEKIRQAKKGKPLSDEHKDALSKAKVGKPIKHLIENKEEISQKISVALRGKPQPNLRGAKHWNWQDGKTKIQAEIRNSLEMKIWRRVVFERDNYTCQVCLKRGGRLVADHIKPFSLFPKLRFDVANGRTICRECDIKSDTYGGRAILKYRNQ